MFIIEGQRKVERDKDRRWGAPGWGVQEHTPVHAAPEPHTPCLQMLLHLFSDANYNLLGFNASFRFSLCPGGCRSHGQCQPPGVCVCEPGWGGSDCGLQECSAYCGSHGTCASVSLSPWTPACDHTFHPHLLALTLLLPETAPASLPSPTMLTPPPGPCSLLQNSPHPHL